MRQYYIAIMRGKYYKRNENLSVINITRTPDDDIPFNNKDDLNVQYDTKKEILILKQSKKVDLCE